MTQPAAVLVACEECGGMGSSGYEPDREWCGGPCGGTGAVLGCERCEHLLTDHAVTESGPYRRRTWDGACKVEGCTCEAAV